MARFGIGPKSQVVEIASNDGYLLQYFRRAGVPVLGVEPAANVAAVAKQAGIPTITDFFGTRLAARLRDEGTRADLLLTHPGQLGKQRFESLSSLGCARSLPWRPIAERGQPCVEPTLPVALPLLAQELLDFWLPLQFLLLEVSDRIARRVLAVGEQLLDWIRRPRFQHGVRAEPLRDLALDTPGTNV